MDRESLERRLAELEAAFEQIQANGNATAGAIAECKYWLIKIDEQSSVNPNPPKS